MFVVYIAGKYMGKSLLETQKNIEAARDVIKGVIDLDCSFVCPHTNGGVEFSDSKTLQWWYDATMELLERCDAVVLVDNWRDSAGALAEKLRAEALGKPVFHSVAELGKWIKKAELN